MTRLPLHPGHPERVCWGCHYHCPPHDLRCGNGTDRAQHPAEIFGADWLEVGLDANPITTTQRSKASAPHSETLSTTSLTSAGTGARSSG